MEVQPTANYGNYCGTIPLRTHCEYQCHDFDNDHLCQELENAKSRFAPMSRPFVQTGQMVLYYWYTNPLARYLLKDYHARVEQ